MSLASVLQTASSGMSAASLTVNVVSNNLANARTNGFKASRTSFATQTPQTFDAGSAPDASSGGTNPAQIGNGVRSGGIVTDNSQGSIVLSNTGEAIELSNTDVGQNLIDLALASQQFRVSTALFRTANSLLDELVDLTRSE